MQNPLNPPPEMQEEPGAETVPRGRWPAMLANLVDVLESEFRRMGRGDDRSLVEAQRTVHAIARYFGGRPQYLPTSESLDRALRDDAIYRYMGKVTAISLAEKYRITVFSVYAIYKQQRALRKQQRDA